MILPFINLEAMADAAYEQEPPGLDRVSFMLGFVAGVDAFNLELRKQLLESQASP